MTCLAGRSPLPPLAMPAEPQSLSSPLDSLRNQCEFLEKSRLKMLKNQDGKKPPTMEALLSYMANQVVVRLPSRSQPDPQDPLS